MNNLTSVQYYIFNRGFIHIRYSTQHSFRADLDCPKNALMLRVKKMFIAVLGLYFAAFGANTR